MSTKIKVNMKPVNTILTRLGVNKTGDVQMFLTMNINRRIARYMPASSATRVLATKLKHIKSPTEIEVLGPYARYQYYGKVMVDSVTGRGPFYIEDVGFRFRKGATLKVTGRNLEYTTTFNPKAGPFWDRRLMAAEKRAIAQDAQAYVRRKK